MLIKALLCILFCISAGGIGSVFTVPAIPEWYNGLLKPSLTPPSWLFAPVWTVLYILMGLAAAIVWDRGLRNPQVRNALIFFLLQLVLNIVWSWLFFDLRSTFYGLADILFLWAMTLFTMVRFFRVSTPAGLLLIPYLLWVTYASGLNLGIYLLNR